jgi:hypothetical protein
MSLTEFEKFHVTFNVMPKLKMNVAILLVLLLRNYVTQTRKIQKLHHAGVTPDRKPNAHTRFTTRKNAWFTVP